MAQYDVGTELNWRALEIVLDYTQDDKDLCNNASKVCAVLMGRYSENSRRIQENGLSTKKATSIR
jgi:hypothetical protein